MDAAWKRFVAGYSAFGLAFLAAGSPHALTVDDDEVQDDGPVVESRDLPPLLGGAVEEAETADPAEDAGPAVGGIEDEGGDGEPALTPRFDTEALPAPVARMRDALIRHATAGDVAAVARLADPGSDGTQRSLDPSETSVEDELRSQSGDADGYETLAIMLDVLEAGYVVLDEGTEDELYLWPYFAAVPLSSLDAAQRVQALRLLTAGDFAESEQFGSYIFYRLGIDAAGRWRFFIIGD